MNGARLAYLLDALLWWFDQNGSEIHLSTGRTARFNVQPRVLFPNIVPSVSYVHDSKHVIQRQTFPKADPLHADGEMLQRFPPRFSNEWSCSLWRDKHGLAHSSLQNNQPSTSKLQWWHNRRDTKPYPFLDDIPFNQMHPAGRIYNLANLSGLESKGCLLKLLLHVSTSEESPKSSNQQGPATTVAQQSQNGKNVQISLFPRTTTITLTRR